MSVSPISDARILALAKEPARPGEFGRDSYPGACYLSDFWDGLHFVLAGAPEERALPLAALKVGEVTFRAGLEAAHAILSHTAQALAAGLQGLSEETLKQRCNVEAMLKQGVYPLRTWSFPEHAESTFRELMFYFEKLREVTVRAAQHGEGLLFYRYEDF